MKGLTLIVAVTAAVLAAAPSALADVRQDFRAPANTTWTGEPSGTKAWGTRTWDVRRPGQAKGWDVRRVAPGNASWTRVGGWSWSDGARRLTWSDGN